MANNILKEINNLAKYSENISFREIAKFILNNYSNIEKYTIFDIANKTATSPSTITRFCKKIGLNGYKSLYGVLKVQNNWQRNSEETSLLSIKKENVEFLDDLFYLTNISLTNSRKWNQESLLLARDLMNKAKNIYLFAKGGNTFLALLFIDWCIRVNLKAFFSADLDQQKAYTQCINHNDDCVIIISYSLSSNFFKEIMTSLHQRNVKMIIITKNDSSELIQKNDILIKIGENEQIIKNRHSGEISTLFLLKALFHALLDEKRLNKLVNGDMMF